MAHRAETNQQREEERTGLIRERDLRGAEAHVDRGRRPEAAQRLRMTTAADVEAIQGAHIRRNLRHIRGAALQSGIELRAKARQQILRRAARLGPRALLRVRRERAVKACVVPLRRQMQAMARLHDRHFIHGGHADAQRAKGAKLFARMRAGHLKHKAHRESRARRVAARQTDEQIIAALASHRLLRLAIHHDVAGELAALRQTHDEELLIVVFHPVNDLGDLRVNRRHCGGEIGVRQNRSRHRDEAVFRQLDAEFDRQAAIFVGQKHSRPLQLASQLARVDFLERFGCGLTNLERVGLHDSDLTRFLKRAGHMHVQKLHRARFAGLNRHRALETGREREGTELFTAQHDLPQRVIRRIRQHHGLRRLVVLVDLLDLRIDEAHLRGHALRHGQDKAVRGRIRDIKGQRPSMPHGLLLHLHEREHLRADLAAAALQSEHRGLRRVAIAKRQPRRIRVIRLLRLAERTDILLLEVAEVLRVRLQ